MANDFTVRIFDQFYNLDLVVNAGEYEIVYSYFDNYTNNSATAKTYTETLFKISNITKIPVLELLQTFQTGTNPDLSRIMTYYLNSVSTKNVLFGFNQQVAPNNNVARNTIEGTPAPVDWPPPPPPPPQIPIAAFTGTPLTGIVPLTVNFVDQSLNFPTSWSWDFTNDGIIDSTLQNPSYTYTAPGLYSVRLTVSNSSGTNTLIKTAYISVVGIPTANFTGSPTSGLIPLTVNFADNSTNSPTSWAWDFTNDGITDSTLQNPTYTYTSVGTYSVKLTAANSAGSSTIIKTNYITALIPAPVANFTGAPLSGYPPLTVNFTDTSTNSPTSWSWDFKNDGSIESTVQNPTFTYIFPGTYSVKLVSSNSSGSGTIVKTDYITVNVCEPYSVDYFPWSGYTPMAGDPGIQEFYNDAAKDGASLNVNLGGYYHSWVGPSVIVQLMHKEATIPSPPTLLVDGAYRYTYLSDEFVDLWAASSYFNITDPTLYARYSVVGSGINGAIVPVPGHSTYPGVTTFSGYYSWVRARNLGEPIIFELWYSLNPSRSNPLKGYCNYTLFGEIYNTGAAPTVHLNLPNSYIKKYQYGILKVDSDMYHLQDSDFIAGVCYEGDSTGGVAKIILNGVVVSTLNAAKPVNGIEFDQERVTQGTILSLGTGKSYINWMEITVYYTDNTYDYVYWGTYYLPDPTGLIDTYLCKLGWIIDCYTGGIEDSIIEWSPATMYTVPDMDLTCAPYLPVPNYIPPPPTT